MTACPSSKPVRKRINERVNEKVRGSVRYLLCPSHVQHTCKLPNNTQQVYLEPHWTQVLMYKTSVGTIFWPTERVNEEMQVTHSLTGNGVVEQRVGGGGLTGAAARWSKGPGPPSASSPDGQQLCAAGHSSWQGAGAA